MKTIIAGSRLLEQRWLVEQAIYACPWYREITEVVCGDASGVDRIGAAWAYSHGLPVKHFPVTDEEWQRYGRPAGPMRNARMAAYADALILIWDGQSRGSKSMLEKAEAAKLRIFPYKIDPVIVVGAYVKV